MDLIETQLKDPIKHWYYRHKFSAIKTSISRDVQNAKVLVDVGAGSALFSHEILKSAHYLTCLAIDTGYTTPRLEDPQNRITYLQSDYRVSGDIYLFTDVLEHVSNDVGLLKAYVDTAPSGALFVITVPAFMSLWSGHDVFLKHVTRYRKESLSDCVINAGLTVESMRYLYVPLFPLVWFIRKLNVSKKSKSQMRDHGRMLNAAANFILKFDSLLARFNLFGMSIILSARKID